MLPSQVGSRTVGRPKTGVSPLLNFRASHHLIAEIEAWAKRRNIGRSEAIRLLAELGLHVGIIRCPYELIGITGFLLDFI